MDLDLKELSVVTVIENVVENIRLKYENATVHIHTSKDYGIKADEFHFTNIIYNLIDNSIKYCENKPEIHITLSEENKALKLEFSDNGIGISKKNLSFIFDKFYRIPSAKSNEVNGFGLGLYYVKKICTLHHWKINAKNNLENGITITLLIPLK